MVDRLFPSVGSGLKLERTYRHGHRCGGRIHWAVRLRAVCDVCVSILARQRLHCAHFGQP